MRNAKLGRIWRYAVSTAAGALFLTAGMSCQNSLKVTNPQNFTTDVLDDPKILQSVADGVEGSLHGVFDDLIVHTALLSDEIEDSSTWIDWADISLGRIRGDWPSSYNGGWGQDGLLRARYAAADAVDRITRVLGADTASKSPMIAQVRTTDAWIDLYLGMDFCEAPLVANGPRAADTELLKQALTKFNNAIAAATSVGTAGAPYLNWALAGRARTNLFLGNFDAAATDAAAVPTGFVKQALYSTNSSTSFAGGQLNQNRNRSGTLRSIWWPMVDTSTNAQVPTPDQYVKDPWTNVNDPRMVVVHPRGRLGVNNKTLSYSIQKYKDYTSPITMTSKREMNLIRAEVYWRKGDVANAVAMLNIDRATVNLAAFPTTLTLDDVFQRILSERFAVMFIEGHRLTDLNRFNLIRTRLGAGRALKFPMGRTEILNNTNMIVGAAKCPVTS
jgi:hypothetical protein